MDITKEEMKDFPRSPIGNENKQQLAEYVDMIYNRHSREEALKKAFPLRYERAIKRSNKTRAHRRANINREANQIERSLFVKTLFEKAHKTWWIKFLSKKQDILENLYNMALSTEVEDKEKISASKVLLQYMPEAPKEDTLVVEHNHKHEVSFTEQLERKKKELYTIANTEVIDVDVEETVNENK